MIYIKKILFTIAVLNHWTRSPGTLHLSCISLFGDTQNSGYGPEQPDLTGKGLGQETSRDLVQSTLFCDSTGKIRLFLPLPYSFILKLREVSPSEKAGPSKANVVLKCFGVATEIFVGQLAMF